MNEENKRLLVVIPCYNEETTIGSVVLKAKRYVNEVVVIDDGSTDKTAMIAEYAGAKVIRHDINKGYGAALKTGFKYARENDFDAMTILDGDGQHDADQIQTVMRPVSEGKADISIGSRFLDSNGNMVPMYRRFGIAVLTKFTNAGSDKAIKVSDGQSGFRAYSRKAIKNIDIKDSQMGASAEIIMQGRKKHLAYEEVPITCSYQGDCSTEKPVGHGLKVMMSILQYMEVEHSLLFFGLPGLILFTLGLFFGFQTYFIYKVNGYLEISFTLITIMFLFLGTLSGMTALILHAVINANRRV
jgi:glycosyltransferase involved in cell wall biosynthesis